MGIGVFCDAPFGNDQAWLSFQLAHFLHHKTINASVTDRVTNARLSQARPNDTSWMLDHAQAHADICNALGIAANPDLGETDLTKRESYEAWMEMHRTEHDLIDRALGL